MPLTFSLRTLVAVTFLLLAFTLKSDATDIKTELQASIDINATEYANIAQSIWELAEMGYLEFESSNILKTKAKEAGFHIESGVADIPTAFVASFGSGKPVLGIMAEFDALPGLSQKASVERDPRIEGAAGHACGHHLFGTASLAAAIAIKNQIKSGAINGTIRLYGMSPGIGCCSGDVGASGRRPK